MPTLQEYKKELKKKTDKQIKQFKLNEKYNLNFLKLYNENSFDFELSMIYDAESIFKYQSIKGKVKTYNEAMKIFKKLKSLSVEIHKLKNWGSLYPVYELNHQKESDFKIKDNFYYKVSKIKEYPHNETLVFYIQYNNLYYNIELEISENNCYYTFEYAGRTKKSRITNSRLYYFDLNFNNTIKLWSLDNVNDFILYNK